MLSLVVVFVVLIFLLKAVFQLPVLEGSGYLAFLGSTLSIIYICLSAVLKSQNVEPEIVALLITVQMAGSVLVFSSIDIYIRITLLALMAAAISVYAFLQVKKSSRLQ